MKFLCKSVTVRARYMGFSEGMKDDLRQPDFFIDMVQNAGGRWLSMKIRCQMTADFFAEEAENGKNNRFRRILYD